MRITTLTAIVAGLALVASACGDDATDESTAETDATAADPAPTETTAPAATQPATTEPAATEPAPATTEPDAGADEFPSAIVSLSPTATEMLFAIGAADQVLAVDDFSNYPPEAADKMVGLSGWEQATSALIRSARSGAPGLASR